jgi:hypothetical protein
MKAVRQHGTRAMYVAEKCRCDACRAANRKYAQLRSQKQADQAVQFLSEVVPAPQVWTLPDGTKQVRHYKRACPGIDGLPCKTHSHLRKDSTGGICSNCRERLKTFVTVLAHKTREHILFLSQNGVGEEAVHQASGVANCIIRDIRQGKQQAVLPETEKRILSVTLAAALPHALVPGQEVWKKVTELRSKGGMTKGEIAQALGNKTPALQLKKKQMTAKSARKVERLHKELYVALEMEKAIEELCADCGYSHAREARMKRVKRMLPCTFADIYTAYPCTYPAEGNVKDSPASRMLYRDLHDLGASVRDGVWALGGAKAAPPVGEDYEDGNVSTSL